MHLHDILKSTWFQQTAPLIVLFLVPTLVFLFSQFLRRLWFSLSFNLPLGLNELVFGVYRSLSMGIESLGLSWLWSSSSSSSSGAKKHKRKASGSKSKSVRTRTDQIALKNVGKQQKQEDYDSDLDDAQYYPGLVNISGTYCFMNSTLQAMASLTYLQPHIQAIQAKAEALDVPTPVIDALQELFTTLNTPKSTYNSLRPQGIINALSTPPPLIPNSSDNSASLYRTSTSLFDSREHQDAQELFQLVSECIKNEMAAVDREGQRDRGIAAVLDLARASNPNKEEKDDLALADAKANKSVFDGLTANRRSCVVCGYTEAVMHFGFDNWQLAVPRLATSCRLEDCLEDYTRLEILKDCICRNCSILATHKRLLQELKTLEEALANPASDLLAASTSSTMPSSSPSSSPSKPKPSNSKKKRYKEVKKMEQRVRTAISEGRIEDDTLLEGVRLEKVVSPASTKQAMIARPPPVLALHLNRSVHYGQFAAKNTIKVYFPEVLDLTPYTTSGSLSTVPTSSISTPSPPPSTSQFQYQGQWTISSGTSDTGSTASSQQQHPRRSTTPTQESYAAGHQRTIYRLSAVVCHYGQHSFGHYICYRRKPRRFGGKWVPPTLVDPLRFEIDESDDSEEEGKGKPNGAAAHPKHKTPNYAGSSSLGESRYYWEDHTEEEVGTGKGWLRISDDAVSECGIESVLAEGSGAFMLYYERAVHPRPGVYLRTRKAKEGGEAKTPNSRSRSRSRSKALSLNGHARHEKRDDSGNVINDDDGSTVDGDAEGEGEGEGDAFSIGSEETLKPEMRVLDLNGSVGSLISEVGVGVMKVTHKKDKDKDKARKLEKHDSNHSMSMSLHLPLSGSGSSSGSVSGSISMKFGARIVRSVNARRRTPETTTSSSALTSPPSSTLSISTAVTTPSTNGSTTHEHDQDMDEKAWADMTASAPSILPSTSGGSANSTSTLLMKTHSQHSVTHSGSLGIGSKSTKVMHHRPPPQAPAPMAGVKVKVAP